MSELYCENCGGLNGLKMYTHVTGIHQNICLCEECSWLPLRFIERRKFPDESEFEADEQE